MTIPKPNAPNALEIALKLSMYDIKTIPLYRVVDGVCNCHKGTRCESPGKHPVQARFYEKATKDYKEISDLYTQNNYNVGIPTGEVNNIVIIDFDGVEGLRTLEKWRMRGLEETWEVHTASGGRHLIYQIPDGIMFEIRNSVKSIAPGVDVRGEHGYTVAPGSIAMAGGYAWVEEYSPDDLDIMPLPHEILALIEEAMLKTKTRVQLEEIDVEVDWKVSPTAALKQKIAMLCKSNQALAGALPTKKGKVRYTSDSDRDWAIIKEMLREGFTDQEITDFIIFMRRENGNKMKADSYYVTSIAKAKAAIAEDLEEEEAERAFLESMTEEEIAEELKIERPQRPTVDAFPIEVFPRTIRDYIEKTSSALSVPHDFVVVNVLAAASVAIGKSYQIEIKKGFTQMAAVYIMLVANPGTSKSPAMNIVFKPIYDMQMRLDSEYEQRKMKYEMDTVEYARKEAEWKKLPKATRGDGPLDDKGDLLRPPTLTPRESVFTTDATPEALAPLMQDNSRTMALLQDELSAHINGMDQYKGGKGADRQFYLSTWANANIRVNRKRDPEPIVVNRTFLTIVGNLPPGTLMQLEALTKHEDGYTDRYLISYPDNQQITEFGWDELADEDEAPWVNVINKLFEAEPAAYYEGEVVPHTLQMTTDAKFEWGEWHAWHHRERTAEDFPQRLQGVYSKMTNQLARITLILHRLWVASGEITDGDIDEEIVKHACKVVDYFKQNARKVYQQMEITQEESRVEEAMEWILSQGGTVTAKELQRYRVCGCAKKEDVWHMLSLLESYGYGHVNEKKNKNGSITKEFHSF